ncbi:MAG: hypothetical protein ACE5IM_05305 [Nitrospinota bacterium]
MGLLQREIERAGIPTVSISNVPEITERVCVPRAVFIQYPFGRLLGDVGDRQGQRRVCDAMAETLVSAEGPNHYRHLPDAWPEPPEATKWRPDEPPPLGKYAREKGIDLAGTLVRAMRDEKSGE